MMELIFDPITGPPSINQLQYGISKDDGSLTLVCQTRDSPPTNISWYRDGVQLDTNEGAGLDMTVTVTNRSSSTFEISLQVCLPHVNINGTYTFEVSNGLGNDSVSIQVNGTIATLRC